MTLIKVVLGSLLTYYFSLFKAPACVIEELEKLRRNFLWGSSDVGRKISWIAWDKVLSSKKGGLEIGSLKAQNLALLCKWLRRLHNEPDSLWISVVYGIHNLERNHGRTSRKKILSGGHNNII